MMSNEVMNGGWENEAGLLQGGSYQVVRKEEEEEEAAVAAAASVPRNGKRTQLPWAMRRQSQTHRRRGVPSCTHQHLGDTRPC